MLTESSLFFFFYLLFVFRFGAFTSERLDANSQPKSQLSPIFGRFNFVDGCQSCDGYSAYDSNSA